MNKVAVLLVGLICVVLVNGRHYEDRNQPEQVEDELLDTRKYRERGGEQRHRRRRWQMAYGYDYQPHSYYPDRRNSYDRNEDVIPQIYRILEDLSDYIKRNQQQPPPPPPPPQPIYVPYPVPYLVPQYINCQPTSVTNKTNITSPNRGNFPVMEDANQNWGLVSNDNDDYEDDGTDGARPISFDPIKPKNLAKPPPQVEHGSSQAEVTTRKSRIPELSNAPTAKPAQPGPCNAAILSCCGNSEPLKQRECFRGVGCDATFLSGGCNQEVINRALNSFKIAYSPVN